MLGVRCRPYLAYLVNLNTLRLNSYSLRSYGADKLLNLLSNDLMNLNTKVRLLIIATLFAYIIVNLYLAILIGYLVAITIAIPFVIMPIQWFISSKASKLIYETSQIKDKRIGICKEKLQGIKMIKLYGWERIFKRKI